MLVCHAGILVTESGSTPALAHKTALSSVHSLYWIVSPNSLDISINSQYVVFGGSLEVDDKCPLPVFTL